MPDAQLASPQPPAVYWEERARRFARDRHGLRAVCSYGMPGFYNWSIEVAQYLAMRRWLAVEPGTRVLDVGCGIGRWSRRLARGGADVTGVDLSPTMVAEATRRTAEQGLSEICRFAVQDVVHLDVEGAFDLVVSVTVLQHVVDPADRRTAIAGLARRLAPGGRMVWLEAAPARSCGRADHGMFRAAGFDDFRHDAAAAGLAIEKVTGVDATLPRRWVLPLYGSLPRPLAHVALAVATAACLPYELFLARRLPETSWHRVMVLRHAAGGGETHPA